MFALPQLNDNWDLVESGSFETASRAMAVHNDSVFRAAEDRLEVCNSAGERARGKGTCVEPPCWGSLEGSGRGFFECEVSAA